MGEWSGVRAVLGSGQTRGEGVFFLHHSLMDKPSLTRIIFSPEKK